MNIKEFLVILVVVIILTIIDTHFSKIERNRCEEFGGIYYRGGIFKATNCVFPPK